MKKGFTLVELLAVIIILAILALVVTPIISKTINDSQTNIDKRSIEGYARSLATTYYQLQANDIGLSAEKFINSKDASSIEHQGGEIVCETKRIWGTDIEDMELYNCTLDDRNYYQYIDGVSTKTKNKIYYDGQVIYFNVSTGNVCSETDYKEDNSKTYYNGINPTGNQTSCLKFYAFNDSDKETLNLILDHNVKVTSWYSTNDNSNGPLEALNKLKDATENWNGTEVPEEYIYSGRTAEYTIEYNSYKARLITANEIAQIVENKNWNEERSTSSGYFVDSLTIEPSLTCKEGNISGCKYGWLYDRTGTECINFGCLNNSDEEINGYWTASADAGEVDYAWAVRIGGNLTSDLVGSTQLGIRPVIEVLKSKL